MTRQSTRVALIVWSHRVGALRQDDKGRVVGVDFIPGAFTALQSLQKEGFTARIVLATPDKAAANAELAGFFPPDWEVTEIPAKKTAAGLTSAFKAAGAGLLIASDREVRALGAKHGMEAWPDAVSALLGVRHGPLLFARLEGDVMSLQAEREFLPYFIESRTGESSLALGLITRTALSRCVARRIQVAILPLDTAVEDPLLVHLDEVDSGTTEALAGVSLLHSEGRRLLVALGAGLENDRFAVHGAHGHYVALWPDPLLWDRTPQHERFDRSVELALSHLEQAKIKVGLPAIGIEVLKLWTPTCPATAAQFQADVDRYTGVAALDAAGPIVSRHHRHPDNARAVQGLMADLTAMGYCPYLHAFQFDGRTLHNVIADLPGRGRFVLPAGIWEKLRDILIRHPLPDPPDPWVREISEIIGSDWLPASDRRRLSPLQLRWALERRLLLYPWYPWWRKLCPLYGIGAKLVLAGCHLDSTAASTPGYVAATGAAPGTDDDASGLAATLAMARWFRGHYRAKLTHTVRFCFFNAEESGLVGSKAYASLLKSQNAPIRAVVCCDMIGYNSDANRIFEVHAGYTDAAVRDASVPIADRIASWAACLGQLSPAQIYKGTSSAGGTDRNLYDGAINRSDHAAFHQQGYAAALASEDFFANLATEPGNDPNPNYHRQTDTVIDAAYAADITCAVAQAVRELAS